jgi:cytochrome P450
VTFSNDPLAHTRLRGLASRAFKPRRADELRRVIARVADERVTRHGERGEIDLLDDFVRPLPIRVLGRTRAGRRRDLDRARAARCRISSSWRSALDSIRADPALRARTGARFSGLIATRRDRERSASVFEDASAPTPDVRRSPVGRLRIEKEQGE